MEKTLNNEAAAPQATGKDAFRARLITHLGQAEIEVVNRILANKTADR